MISPKSLVTLLHDGGRDVSLAELADWRKKGLLPQLASKGMRRQGRHHFWQGPEIVRQAEFVYDSLHDYRAVDEILSGLWLAGFHIPIPIFRRAWLNKQRQERPWQIRQVDDPADFERCTKKRPSDLGGSLLSMAVLTNELLSLPHHKATLLNQVLQSVLEYLGYPCPRIAGAELIILFEVIFALELSELLSKTTDDDLVVAQIYLSKLGKLISAATGDKFKSSRYQGVWGPKLAVGVGTPALWLILALLRLGYKNHLEGMSDSIGRFFHPEQYADAVRHKGSVAARNLIRTELEASFRKILARGDH